MAHDSPSPNVSDVTEIVLFDDYKQNDVHAAAVETASAQNGCNKLYYGRQVENGTKGIWVQEWTSLVHHEAFQKSDVFPSFLEGVPAFGKVEKILHFALPPDADKKAIYEAPVTEVLIATLKPETPRGRFEEVLGLMHGGVNATKGALASSSATTVENPDTYVYVCGWDSVESHKEALAPEYAQDMVKALEAMLDIIVKHYTLSSA